MLNKDIIWIVAGNRQEFDSYVKRKAQAEHDIRNYKFVYTADEFRGLDDIKGFYIGSYKSRPDIDDIKMAIAVRKSQKVLKEANFLIQSSPLLSSIYTITNSSTN
jgi:hypothetical protein